MKERNHGDDVLFAYFIILPIGIVLMFIYAILTEPAHTEIVIQPKKPTVARHIFDLLMYRP